MDMFILVISVIILNTIACPSYICASNITCCDQHFKIALSLETIENTLKKFTPGLVNTNGHGCLRYLELFSPTVMDLTVSKCHE